MFITLKLLLKTQCNAMYNSKNVEQAGAYNGKIEINKEILKSLG